MNHSQIRLALAALTGTLFVAGCATETPVMDRHFGEAVNLAKAQQTIDPDASLNPDPVTGIDGRSGKYIMERYRNSFQNPPPPVNVFTIGVGTGGGAMTSSAASK